MKPFFYSLMLMLLIFSSGLSGYGIRGLVDSDRYNTKPYLHDYQLDIHVDTVRLYDAGRLVGSFVNEKWNSKLDSIILNDNK